MIHDNLFMSNGLGCPAQKSTDFGTGVATYDGRHNMVQTPKPNDRDRLSLELFALISGYDIRLAWSLEHVRVLVQKTPRTVHRHGRTKRVVTALQPCEPLYGKAAAVATLHSRS